MVSARPVPKAIKQGEEGELVEIQLKNESWPIRAAEQCHGWNVQ